jgi:hypothetical protein
LLVDWEPRFGGRAELCLIADTPEGELLPAAPIVLGGEQSRMGCVRLWATTWGSPRSLAQWNSTKNGKKTSKGLLLPPPGRPSRNERSTLSDSAGSSISVRRSPPALSLLCAAGNIFLTGFQSSTHRPTMRSALTSAGNDLLRGTKTPAGNPNGNSRTFAKDGLRSGQCNFFGENADYATVGHTAIITSKSMRLQRKINAIIETTSAVRLMTSIRCSPASAL